MTIRSPLSPMLLAAALALGGCAVVPADDYGYYDLSLTPPSNTSRRKARSTRRPARHRKRPCIYAGVGLSRAGGWPAAA